MKIGRRSFGAPLRWRVFHRFYLGFMPCCGLSCWKTVRKGDKKVALLGGGTFRLSRMFRVCRAVLQGVLVGLLSVALPSGRFRLPLFPAVLIIGGNPRCGE